jgi:hypothetical protein
MQNFDNYHSDDIPEGMRPHETIDPWAAADKSWLKAKGRSLRSIFDSLDRPGRDGSNRFRAAGVGIAAIAAMVGLSAVMAGPSTGENVLAASLNPLAPLGFISDHLSGSASAQALEECGPLAGDVALATDSEVQSDASVNPGVIDSLAPILTGGIPGDIPTVPPVGDPFPPTDPQPPTVPPEPPVPPTPPTPPTTPTGNPESEGNLIGADLNLLGQDVANVGILNGGLLGVGVDSLNPDGTGTGSTIGVTDGNGEEIVGLGLDPQDDGVADVSVNGEDPLAATNSDTPVADLVGDQPVADLVGDQPVADLLGGDPVGSLLGNDPIGGLTGGLLN